LLKLSVHPDRRGDLVTRDELRVSVDAPLGRHEDEFGNLVTMVLAPEGPISFSSDFVIEDTGLPDTQNLNAGQLPIEDLPKDTLQFLVASRYCESDELSDLAWSLFGGVPAGWPRVQAIVDYVHDRITFGYPHARSTRTAVQAHEERVGVCRDFAHLAVALCRAMNVPARYCTGYLGDIGIPPVDAPMDFSAWFEVYLDGGWFTFDARHNRPRIGRVVIARGRDAADVAITHSFGKARLTSFKVWTDEVAEVPADLAPAQLIAAE
jgi:transglutaminase-like putative cysteine protease